MNKKRFILELRINWINIYWYIYIEIWIVFDFERDCLCHFDQKQKCPKYSAFSIGTIQFLWLICGLWNFIYIQNKLATIQMGDNQVYDIVPIKIQENVNSKSFNFGLSNHAIIKRDPANIVLNDKFTDALQTPGWFRN